jgi:hypothetical protein
VEETKNKKCKIDTWLCWFSKISFVAGVLDDETIKLTFSVLALNQSKLARFSPTIIFSLV